MPAQPSLDFALSPPVGRADTPVTRELKRLSRLALDVLARLQAGWASNVELNTICFRYGGRIHELRRQHHDIRKAHVEDGEYVYWINGRA